MVRSATTVGTVILAMLTVCAAWAAAVTVLKIFDLVVSNHRIPNYFHDIVISCLY